MEIKIEGLDELKTKLGRYANQLPFALSKALNDTIYGARQAVGKEIRDVFDRPTPQIQRGVRYTKADKRNLAVSIYLARGEGSDIDIESILRPHIKGGERLVKASERRLRRFGFMGPDQWIVPGPGAPLDRYGNISAANMARILGQIQAYQEAGYNKRKQKKSKAVGTVYAIPRVGVFRRTGPQSSIPVLLFTSAPQYEQRFDFYYVVENYVKKNFHRNFSTALEYAIRTAR